jgi:abortive infection bacteriophage resistance protein
VLACPALRLGLFTSGVGALMAALLPPKPFMSLPELSALLSARGMAVADSARAERKLGQVGYYRLSGFWFPCRQYALMADGQVLVSAQTGKPIRQDVFLPGTSFEDVFALYLFDKRLRLLMLDALERIEVFVRSAIAHEVGYHDALAYQDSRYMNPKQTRSYVDKRGVTRNPWTEWTKRQQDQVNRCQEDHIVWHRQSGKSMPFWVVAEAWDFGTVSKYFEMLKGDLQNKVCARLGVDNAKVLKVWLQELNTLRNRCAHHTRIWNQSTGAPLPLLPVPYFERLSLDVHARTRLLGLVALVDFLVRQIGPNSTWIRDVADVMDTKPDLPGCGWGALGLVAGKGFPRAGFGL